MVFTGFDVLNIIPAFAYTASAIRDVAVLVVSVAGRCQCTLHGEGIGVWIEREQLAILVQQAPAFRILKAACCTSCKDLILVDSAVCSSRRLVPFAIGRGVTLIMSVAILLSGSCREMVALLVDAAMGRSFPAGSACTKNAGVAICCIVIHRYSKEGPVRL
jgi:hypothetical protein